MQYINSELSSRARAVSRCLFLVEGVALVVVLLGDDEDNGRYAIPLIALTILTTLAVALGGFCEVSILGDRTFLELRNCPIFAHKGRQRTYSIEADRLISARQLHILFLFHYQFVTYHSHYHNQEKHVRMGLSLVPRRQRIQLRQLLETIQRDHGILPPLPEHHQHHRD